MANSYGSQANVDMNIETIISQFTTSSAIKLKGFIGTGNAPGRYVLRTGGIAGTILATYRTSGSERTAYVLFPDIDVVVSTIVCVSVVNEEFDGTHDYEATIIYA